MASEADIDATVVFGSISSSLTGASAGVQRFLHHQLRRAAAQIAE